MDSVLIVVGMLKAAMPQIKPTAVTIKPRNFMVLLLVVMWMTHPSERILAFYAGCFCGEGDTIASNKRLGLYTRIS
jgi:hypothetical protein